MNFVVVDNHSQKGYLRMMIICVCRNINGKAVEQAVAEGARSPEAVQSYHGCSFNCGKCRSDIAQVIQSQVEHENQDRQLIAAE